MLEKTSKRNKFVELAQKRTVKAMHAIRQLGYLGNRSAYEFTEADVKKIVAALTNEIEAVKAKLGGPGKGDDIDFSL